LIIFNIVIDRGNWVRLCSLLGRFCFYTVFKHGGSGHVLDRYSEKKTGRLYNYAVIRINALFDSVAF